MSQGEELNFAEGGWLFKADVIYKLVNQKTCSAQHCILGVRGLSQGEELSFAEGGWLFNADVIYAC